jgi:hypothetical protein
MDENTLVAATDERKKPGFFVAPCDRELIKFDVG